VNLNLVIRQYLERNKMSSAKTVRSAFTNNSTPLNKPIYKLQDNTTGFVANSFPIRHLSNRAQESKIKFVLVLF
jgi:hypothetical protein